MKYKNYKIYICLRNTLILMLILSLTGYYLFHTIKEVILNDVDNFISAINRNNLLNKVRNLILTETLLLILIASPLTYIFTSERISALYMDYLTEINNKRFYDMKLKKYIKRIQVTNKPLSIMMIDIDSFKKINDSYGHDNGDIVLKHLAKIIRTNIRKTDICCRFGGDEFVVILPDSNDEQAKIIGERIVENLKYYPFLIEGYNNQYKSITVSVGIAECNDNEDAERFSKCADEALYISKSLGRGKITLYGQ